MREEEEKRVPRGCSPVAGSLRGAGGRMFDSK